MKKPIAICFALLAIALTTAAAQASSIDLGIAGEYNAFVFENFSASGGARGVEGRLAAGGNVTLDRYNAGTGLATDASGENNTVIAGGNLNLDEGVIYNGNAVIGGTATIPENGNSTPDGSINIVENTSELINWANQQAYLTDLSSQLNAMQNTGTVEYKWSGIHVTTDSTSDVQVFDVDGEDWSSASWYTFANENTANTAPSNATFVFNISGTSVSMQNAGMERFLAALGESYDNVLFNFYEAIDLTLSSIDVEGTILAPLAHITATDGNINGNVIAKSFDGTRFGINDRLFESGGGDPVPPAPVPEPGTLVLFSCGLLLFSGWIKKIMPGKLNA